MSSIATSNAYTHFASLGTQAPSGAGGRAPWSSATAGGKGQQTHAGTGYGVGDGVEEAQSLENFTMPSFGANWQRTPGRS